MAFCLRLFYLFHPCQYIVIHRIQPSTQNGYIVVAHCAFGKSKGRKDRGFSTFCRPASFLWPWLINLIQVNHIKLRRQKASYIFGYSISIPSYEPVKTPALLRGLPSKLSPVPPGAAVEGSDAEGPFTDIIVPENFPPGSMMVFATSMTGLDPSLDALCHSGAAGHLMTLIWWILTFYCIGLVEKNAMLLVGNGIRIPLRD
jgi:glycogen debranching enzyme